MQVAYEANKAELVSVDGELRNGRFHNKQKVISHRNRVIAVLFREKQVPNGEIARKL